VYTRHFDAHEPHLMSKESTDLDDSDIDAVEHIDQGVYVDYMLANLKLDKEARRMMLVDWCQIGCVLKRKYRLLRFSYSFLASSALLSATLFVYKTLSG
jgi:hypothetical protein